MKKPLKDLVSSVNTTRPNRPWLGSRTLADTLKSYKEFTVTPEEASQLTEHLDGIRRIYMQADSRHSQNRRRFERCIEY
jgi:hypothetical protein